MTPKIAVANLVRPSLGPSYEQPLISNTITSPHTENVAPTKPVLLLLAKAIDGYAHCQFPMRALSNVCNAERVSPLMRCHCANHPAFPTRPFSSWHPIEVCLVKSSI